MIENGFVYAFDKDIARREKAKQKEEKRIEPLKERFYKILDKYKSALPDINKNQLTKTEYNFMVKYIKTVLKHPLSLYPNMQ